MYAYACVSMYQSTLYSAFKWFSKVMHTTHEYQTNINGADVGQNLSLGFSSIPSVSFTIIIIQGRPYPKRRPMAKHAFGVLWPHSTVHSTSTSNEERFRNQATNYRTPELFIIIITFH